MLSPEKLKLLQVAAQYLEREGAAGLRMANKLVGEDTAMAMLVMHLRRNLGSMDIYPADPAIEERVFATLKEEALA